MTSIKYFPFITLAFTALAGMTRGQTASDLNEGSQLTHDPGTDAFSFSWWGRSGRTYFLQQSEDLASWQYLPLIEAGQEGIVQWGFSTNADRLFLRLKHTDIPTLDPLADDFDGDNISNWNELLQESDPLAALDWNTNGIPDDWELFWDSEIAVFPTPLELDLDWGTQAPRSLYLNNPTATAANYSVALTGDTVSGYSWEDSQTGTIAYVWTDISTTGTALASIANVDSDSEKITLSQFAFPYYGRNHGEIWVCSNGYLNFKQEYNDSSNDELPDYYSPYGVIAPFWNDLHTGDGGDIYYKEETNRLIVQYEAVAKDDGSGANTFQIILNADGSIEFHYKQMDGDLDECSVGIQNVSRNQGIQLRYNTDASNLVSLQYSYAIRFNPTKTLFTLALLNGNVASATAAELIATFDAENVIPGTYTGSLAITHDGTGTSPWNVPVQVNIPYAKMTEPNSGYTLWEGETLSSTGAYLRAKFVDTPDEIDFVEFRFGNTLIGTDSTATNDEYQSNWSNVPAGEHQVFARVVLDNGQTNDSLPVLVDVTPDSDGDRMDDRWEQDNFGGSPANFEASADFDGDGFPNIFEYHHGSDPADPLSFPVFSTTQNTVSPDADVGAVNHFRVDGTSNTAFEKSTIQAALNAANDFDVIEVLPGIYNEDIYLGERVYLFSRDGARATIIDGTDRSDNVVDLYSESVIEGFTIRNGGSTTTISDGAGMYVSEGGNWNKPRVVGCLFANNFANDQGGAIYVYSGDLTLESCTLVNNKAAEGPAIHSASNNNDIRLINTLLWNPDQSGAEISGSISGLVLASTITRDGSTGNVSLDGVDQGTSKIGLTPWFGIYHSSPAYNSGSLSEYSEHDFDNEERTDSMIDIGADEVSDTNTNDIADTWESWYGITDPSADPDSDGLTNLQEYQKQTDPYVDDTDGDGLPDGDEVILGTDPTVADLSSLDGDYNFDGLDDSIGVILGFSPTDMDVDGDGISNADEIANGTNPFLADSDGDGVNDDLDAFPNDPSMTVMANDPQDTTAPFITLRKPPEATPL